MREGHARNVEREERIEGWRHEREKKERARERGINEKKKKSEEKKVRIIGTQMSI